MPRATPQISTDTATHLFELYDHVKAIFDYFPTLSILVNQSGPLQSAGIYKAVANALYEHIVSYMFSRLRLFTDWHPFL